MAHIISKKALKKLPIVKYEAIRNELKTGDLFFGSGSYLFSGIIQRLTKSTWSHVAIIYKDEELGRVLVLESEPFIGVRLIPLSKYLNDYKGSKKSYRGQIALAKLAIPLDKQALNKGISFGLDELTRPYDNFEIIRIMIRMYFKITKRANNRSYICSEFVRDILEESNVVLPYNNTYISPDDVWTDKRLVMTHRIL
ncbi:MAG: YiiX/YebB-like N1pC/P60 family cysteine hydrolase [Saprospiraceae bacterium]|nr:YiiX/YebB-like N1pC/P60 family cysteine hydrolase [Saprospiraceae bacterium]